MPHSDIVYFNILYYMACGRRGCVGCRQSKLESSLLPISQAISTCASRLVSIAAVVVSVVVVAVAGVK